MYSDSVKKISRRESIFWKIMLLAIIALTAFLLTTIQGWLTAIE